MILLSWTVAVLGGCTQGPAALPPPPTPTRAPALEGPSVPSVALSAASAVHLQRGAARQAAFADEAPLGPWTAAAPTPDGRAHWTAALPYPPSSTAALHGEEAALTPGPGAPGAGLTGSVDSVAAHVFTEGPPPQGIRLRDPVGAASARALLPPPTVSTSQLDQRAHVGASSLDGFPLPTPGEARFEVEVPPSGELVLSLGRGGATAGVPASLSVSIDGERAVLWAVPTSPSARVVDLSRHAGERVTLSLRTSSDGATVPVFVGVPRISTRQATPRRVVWVMVDGLRAEVARPGASRDPLAPLRGFSDGAVQFQGARATAPWTTPSWQVALSGRTPEQWSVEASLPRTFAAAGWRTVLFSTHPERGLFEPMSPGFAEHHHLRRDAASTTDAALQWLGAHDGEDAFMVVHYGDLIMPWSEPPSIRSLYAAPEPPAPLQEQPTPASIHAHLNDMNGPQRQWLRDRYDGVATYVSGEVERLIAELGDDDIVVFGASHGTEWFEHTYTGHGRTLFDEQLRVPLWIRAPGLPPSIVDDPVGLIDLAPTLLELVPGLAPFPTQGDSLAPLASRAPGASEPFLGRTMVFGWTRQISPWWGLLQGGHKWIGRQGREQLYDVSTDPEELIPLLEFDMAPARPWRQAFPAAIGTDVLEGWRFEVTPIAGEGPVHDALCSVEGGFSRWAIQADPYGQHRAEVRSLSSAEAEELLAAWDADDHPVQENDGHVLMSFTGHGPEVFVDTVRPMEEVGRGARCTPRWCVQGDSARPCPLGTLRIPPQREPGYGDRLRIPMSRLAWSMGRQFVWGKGMTPLGTFVDHHDVRGRDAP